MPGLLSTISRAAEYFGVTGKNNESQGVDQEQIEDATAHSRSPDRMQSEEQKYEGSAKRPIPVDSQDSPPRKRQDTRSATERRLTGDYSAPNTAVRIGPVTRVDSDDSEKRATPRTAMHKPGSGPPHIRNTLNQPSPHVNNARKPASASFMNPNKEIRKLDVNRQTIKPPKAQADLPAPARLSGDGFEDYELARGIDYGHRPTKKAKLEVRSSAVDTTDDDDVVEILGVNGRGLPEPHKSPQGSRDTVVSPGYFKPTEFATVDALSSNQDSKKKRRSKDGRASSQASSREMLADASNGRAHEPELAIQRKFDRELVEDSHRAEASDIRPPINLMKDLDKVKSASTQSSTNGKTDTTKKVQRPTGHLTQPRVRSRNEPSTAAFQEKIRLHPTTTKSIPPFGSRNDSGSLNEKFVRDVEPPVRRPRATDRMKAEAYVDANHQSISKSDDSVDELAGETTIGSQASRSVSPQKDARGRQSKSSGATDRRKSLSPGHLESTQFTEGGQRPQASKRRTGSSNATNPKSQNGTVRIRGFYATTFILEAGELTLQFDGAAKQFDLHCNGDLQILRGRRQAVSIGASEARTFTYCRNSRYVHLTGSITSNSISNGHICIAFCDSDGVKSFMHQLAALTDHSMKTYDIDEDRCYQTFVHQVKDITARNAKQKVLDVKAQSTAAARAKQSGTADEEAIQYESSPITQSKRGGLFERSRYFAEPEDNNQRRRSSRPTRQTKRLSLTPEPEPPRPKWTQIHEPQRWSHSVVYPPEGLKRVTVDFQDLERLDEGEFLNDNIISFALRRIEETMSSEHKEDVFFFNSFFYTALTYKNGQKHFNYDAVKRWTKNKDLFTLPYVVVPINIDLHWFVVIICNLPSVSHKAAGLDDDDDEHDEEGPKHTAPDIISSTAAVNGDDVEVLMRDGGATSHQERTPSSRTLDGVNGEDVQAQTTAMDRLSISQEDENTIANHANGAENDLAAEDSDVEVIAKSKRTSTGPKKSKKRAPPPPKKYNPDKPTIITLDSFGSSHATETRNLKDYLKAEADAKRGMELDIKELQGMTAKGIPEQTNFCDCGLYLVGYVEEFAKNPRQFVTKVLTRQLDRQADFASFNPSEKRDEIRNALLKLHEEQEADRKTKKSAKKTTAKGVADVPKSSPTPAAPAPTRVVDQHLHTLPVYQAAVDVLPTASKQSQPAMGSYDQYAQVDVEDKALSQEVPRALQDPVIRKIETSSPPPILQPQKDETHPATAIDQSQTELTSLDYAKHVKRVPTDVSDEMLDTGDAPMDDSFPTFRCKPEHEPKGDLLDSFEQVVEDQKAQLNKHPVENESTDQQEEVAAHGKAERSKRRRSPMVLIEPVQHHLEIPESDADD